MSPRPFLTAHWRHLLMLHFEMDPRVLAPLVPAGTVLDTWRGTTFASLVAFQFLETRLVGVPVPFHGRFEEINLRFYVRRLAGAETRRAVVFIRELVPRWAVAAIARAAYHEPYRAVPTRSRISANGASGVEYGWRLGGRWHTIAARAEGVAAPPEPGSLEEFVTEHHWGYTRRRDGTTAEYEVAHPPWRVQTSRDLRLDADFAVVYGPDLARWLVTPRATLIADGSRVEVFWPRRL